MLPILQERQPVWAHDLFQARHSLKKAQDTGVPVLVIVSEPEAMAPCAAWLRVLGCPQHTLREWPGRHDGPDQDDPWTAHTRMTTLACLLDQPEGKVVITTPRGLMEKIPPAPLLRQAVRTLRVGDALLLPDLVAHLQRTGYLRTDTVYDPGQYTVRGGIVDLFAPGSEYPLRLDFWGDTLESLRFFEPLTQRSTRSSESFTLWPAREVVLCESTMRHFRTRFREEHGASAAEDPLYQSVSEGKFAPGLEALVLWLYEEHTALPFLMPPETQVLGPSLVSALMHGVWKHTTKPDPDLFSVDDIRGGLEILPPLPRSSTPVKPLNAAAPFTLPGWLESLGTHTGEHTTLFVIPGEADLQRVQHLVQGRLPDASILPVHTLGEIPGPGFYSVQGPDWAGGWVSESLQVITSQDLFGQRQQFSAARKRKPAEALLRDLFALKPGDHVVHQMHGIGRFEGLKPVALEGTQHECCLVVYAGEDRLLVPVEHIHLLSRYGGADAQVALDCLGGTQWQTRKQKVARRLRMMTAELVALAAQRAALQASVCAPEGEAWERFCAGFEWVETDEQMQAIADVLHDLAQGSPMDRVICGDVGFGKTEVALRAAFAVVSAGDQVVVVCPTTLLCRQHALNFQNRFRDTPFQVGQLSRMVPAAEAEATRARWNEGKLNILVATHAVLNKTLTFGRTGLVVLDEEQHFGVSHKERFKALNPAAHLLTLSATPIPRTFQMALSGLRTLSLIRTPPVARSAVHTVLAPWAWDTVLAMLDQEKTRGGQAFVVTPHIAGLEPLRLALAERRPEWHVAVAHGQMPPRTLEEVMTRFTRGETDILLCTSIVESGLDIPRANTIIIHHADQFGLAPLYQLRGRVGRSSVPAFALLTFDPDKPLTGDAHKRLEVMRSLDHLGASFMLAHHDMDIRGAGNLLGAEQSGHIRDVGVEVYQSLLAEAAEATREGKPLPDDNTGAGQSVWTPVLNTGLAVMIPESWMPDLNTRLTTYRTLNQECMAGRTREARQMLADRFGPVPPEVDDLLQLMDLQRRCQKLGISRVDAGNRGATVTFWQDQPLSVDKLLNFAQTHHPVIRIRPDHRLVYTTSWDSLPARLKGLAKLLAHLEKVFFHP